MAKSLREDPTAVTAEMSGWLSNPDSPALWAPFAFSIRGFAYEVMDECELARMDYIQGLNLYDTLLEELGEDVLRRMTNNMKFMRVRLEVLPPAAVSPVESYSYFEQYPSETAGKMAVSTPICQGKQVTPDDQAGHGNEGEWHHETSPENVDGSVPEQIESEEPMGEDLALEDGEDGAEELDRQNDELMSEQIELDEHKGEDVAMADGGNQAEELDEENDEHMPATTNQEKIREDWEDGEDDEGTEIGQRDAVNESLEGEHKDEEDAGGEVLAADGGITGDVPITQDQPSGEEPPNNALIAESQNAEQDTCTRTEDENTDDIRENLEPNWDEETGKQQDANVNPEAGSQSPTDPE